MDNYNLKKDDWHEKGEIEITEEMKDRLSNYHPKDQWQKWRRSDKYVSPIGRGIVKCIFCILFSLWGVAVITALVAIMRMFILN